MSLLLAVVGTSFLAPGVDAARAVRRSNWDTAQQRQVVVQLGLGDVAAQ